MGFEVTYSYHERVEGEYNKDEVKTFKKKVGDPFEDVSLEKLAGAVMAQLARRDIWITDVEVFELSKKPISFKETKGGIVLKNRKFLFDGGGEESSTILVEEIMQPAPVAPTEQQPIQPQYVAQEYSPANPSAHPHNSGPRRPIDYVIFQPELHQMPEIKQRGLRFTPDKKYAVFEKRAVPLGGENYVINDDVGREQIMSDKYFVPVPQLFADRELGFSENQQQRDGGKLYWGGGSGNNDMPDIRRR